MIFDNKPKNDPEIEQKYFLISFVSQNGKREKGKTFGIKLYGSFQTKEQAEEYISLVKSEEESYFDIYLDQIGKWISFSDKHEINADNTIFLNSTANSDFSGNVDINEMYRELNENFKKKEHYQNNIKQVIKTKTYFEKPETKEENKEFLEYIFKNLLQEKENILFFKQSIENNIKKMEEVKDEKDLDLSETNCEEDYYISLNTENPPQKYALISFVDETTPRQKGKTFMIKIRGCYSSEKELQERRNEILSFDNSFDLYKVPLGEWIPFKNSHHFEPETYEELNKILYNCVQFLIKSKKDFELRRLKAKNGEEIEDVKFTKHELENIISRLKEKLSKNSELFTYILKCTKKYLKYSKDVFQQDFTKEQYEEFEKYNIKLH